MPETAEFYFKELVPLMTEQERARLTIEVNLK
jgi:hypothetical protein